MASWRRRKSPVKKPTPGQIPALGGMTDQSATYRLKMRPSRSWDSWNLTEASQCKYTLICPLTGPATNLCPENGLGHLRIVEGPDVHVISPQLLIHHHACEHRPIATVPYDIILTGGMWYTVIFKENFFSPKCPNESIVKYTSTSSVRESRCFGWVSPAKLSYLIWLVYMPYWYNGISTFVGYSMSNPFF